MKMYNDTEDGEKIVSYTVTNKILDKNVKFFLQLKKKLLNMHSYVGMILRYTTVSMRISL